MTTKIKKKKLSDCCNAPMIGGVQCENCGSNGKFSTGTAIIKRLDKIIKLIAKEPSVLSTSGKEVSNGRFIDCDNGTIKDTKLVDGKRLQWQKQGSTERLTYAQAEEFVAELNKEEFNDWRIPTREELESILDLTKHDPAIDPIFKCESAGYWSSTPYADYTGSAWDVHFDSGDVYGDGRYNDNYVRPVRQY